MMGWGIEGVEELAGEGGGEFLVDTVDSGPLFREPCGTEEAVDEGEDEGEVAVAMFVVGVMPVMEGRGGDEPFQGAEADADIGVNEEGPDRTKDCDEGDGGIDAGAGGLGEAEEVDGGEAEEANEDHVEGMGAGVYEPVEFLSAVMDGVETPEDGMGMQDTVAPVSADVIDEHHEGEPDPERPEGHCGVEAAGIDGAQRMREQRERDGNDGSGDDAVDEVPCDVDADLLAPDLRGTDGA